MPDFIHQRIGRFRQGHGDEDTRLSGGDNDGNGETQECCVSLCTRMRRK